MYSKLLHMLLWFVCTINFGTLHLLTCYLCTHVNFSLLTMLFPTSLSAIVSIPWGMISLMVTVILVVVVVFPELFEVVVVVDPVTVPAVHSSPSATTILLTVTVTEVQDFGGTPPSEIPSIRTGLEWVHSNVPWGSVQERNTLLPFLAFLSQCPIPFRRDCCCCW